VGWGLNTIDALGPIVPCGTNSYEESPKTGVQIDCTPRRF